MPTDFVKGFLKINFMAIKLLYPFDLFLKHFRVSCTIIKLSEAHVCEVRNCSEGGQSYY